MQVVFGREDHAEEQIVQICDIHAVALAITADESRSNAQVKEDIHRQNMGEIGCEVVPDLELTQTTPPRDDLFDSLHLVQNLPGTPDAAQSADGGSRQGQFVSGRSRFGDALLQIGIQQFIRIQLR